MVFRRLIVAGAALGLLSRRRGLSPPSDPNPDGYTVNTLVTGPVARRRPRQRLGSQPPGREPVVGRRQRDRSVDALQRRRIEAGRTSRLDPGWRPDRHRLECERGRRRLPRRPVPVQQRGRHDQRVARRPRQTAEVGNDHSWDGAVYKGLAIGTADVGCGPQQYLYATDFHNGKIDVFDKNFADQTWAGAFRRPEAPEGICPVRDPDPQRHDLRDVREDPAGQR